MTAESDTEYPSNVAVALSEFRFDDAEKVAAGDLDPEHRLRFDSPENFQPSLQHATDVITAWHRDKARRTRFTYAVRDAQTGSLLGGCQLQPLSKASAALSYWTYKDYRGQGIATQAVSLCLAVAREAHAFSRIVASVDPDNQPSQKVLLRNLFVREGSDGIKRHQELTPWRH